MTPGLASYLDAERKATYDRKSFQPLALYGTEPVGMFVQSTSPYQTLKDLIDAAKAKTSQIKVGDNGIMSGSHLVPVILADMAGIKFGTVHFDGVAPTTTALLGGHIDVASGGAVTALPHIKTGAARMLAIAEREPQPLFPGMKTFKEQGYDLYMPGCYGMILPAGTPKEIVDILTNSVKKSMGDEELKKKLAEVGVTPQYKNPDEYAAYWTEYENMVKKGVELAKKEG